MSAPPPTSPASTPLRLPALPALPMRLALLGGLALTACGENEPPPAVPEAPHAAPAVTVASAPLPDDVACARRKTREAACPNANPADAEVRGRVCMSERACLGAVWATDAIDRYMACRSASPCGTDCQREVVKKTPPGRELVAATAQCQKLCAGGGSDGAPLCTQVLGKFTTWSASAQAQAVQCFAAKSDCFDALECARAAASGPEADRDSCLGKAVGRACLDGGDAPMCREIWPRFVRGV
jgi:hypothetical protein